MTAISLLSNTDYILANKSIARRFGLDCAVLLGELASEYAYLNPNDEDADIYSDIFEINSEIACHRLDVKQ